jgi:ABC-type transporter Mla subunit MlaD
MSGSLRWDLYGDDHLSETLATLAATVDKMGKQLDSLTGQAKETGESLGDTEKKAKGLGDTLAETGESAEDAAAALDNAAVSTERLDREVEEAEASLKRLNREFARTGDKGILIQIRGARAALAQLRQVRKGLDDVGDEAIEAGRKIGVAMSAQILGRVGAVLPGALSGVFSKMPPQVQAGVAVAAAAIAVAFSAAFGAAVVAGILVAVGGGVLAAGITAAAKHPAVSKAWSAVGDQARSSLSGFRDAFISPLTRAAGTFGDALKRMGPTLTSIGQLIAPVIDKLAPALADMAENMLPGIVAGVQAATPLFDTIAAHLPTIGTAITKFFNAIAAGAPGAQLFLDHLLRVVELLLPAAGGFFGFLAAQYQLSVSVFVGIGKAVLWLVRVFLQGWKLMIDVAAKIPGPHQNAMRKLSRALDGGIKKTKELSRSLDNLKKPREARVSVKTAAAMEKLRSLNRRIAAVVYDRTMGITVAVHGGGRITERAHGGEVEPGRAYKVGERRGELFMPGVSGTVVPFVPTTPAPSAVADQARRARRDDERTAVQFAQALVLEMRRAGLVLVADSDRAIGRRADLLARGY